MKKLFKYEINESIAANAAMNCLKNRNNHKQLNETSEFDARFEFRKDLRELASPVAKKAYMIIRKQYGDGMWRRLYMDDCDERGLIDMLNMYAERGLEPQQIVNKMMGVQEQEEGTDDKETFALKLVKKFKNKMTPDYAKKPEMFMMLKLQKAIKKPLMSLSKEEYQAWAKAICNACESVFGSAQEQEEEDYTNDEIPSPNFSYRMSFMVWAMRNIIPYLKEMSQVCAQADPTELKHAVMKILKTRDTGTPETPRSCKEWAKENYDWVEMELNGEYDDYQKKWSKPFNITPSITSEQEEMPEMEQNDIKQALTQYLSEVWIDTTEDGDLDELYYAVSDYLNATGDYPASAEWEDCEPWCEEHYQDIENLFLGGSLS